VPEGAGTQGLQPLDLAGQATHLALVSLVGGQPQGNAEKAPTSVSLFDQGLTQIFQASATGLQPKMPYVLALASEPDGKGKLEVIAAFMTNPAGSAIVNTVGPIRQIVQGEQQTPRRYLAIAEGHPDKRGGAGAGEIVIAGRDVCLNRRRLYQVKRAYPFRQSDYG
jgi:hypothetical protein